MKTHVWRQVGGTLALVLGLFLRVAEASVPQAGFTSLDPRLPNPDRPYEMTSGTVNFNAPPYFGLYDLEFAPRNPEQLDIPARTDGGPWKFESKFDISYKAMVSFGLEPVRPVSGIGTAHVVGTAPAGEYFEPQVFDTELVGFTLGGLSPIPEVYFRESPTRASKGITIREDTCPPCLAPGTRWRIASFFDVHGEFSYNGGNTWTPGNKSFRIEQAPGPGIAGDYDGDGSVDAADYVLLRNGFGETYSQLDLLLWRANFGNTTRHGAAASAALIPEPASVFLFCAGLAGLACCRRRAR